MSDLSQGQSASLILKPGDVYRIGTGGVATVRPAYGAPSVTTTLTAQTQDFGPYDAPVKLEVSAISGTASYSIRTGVPVTVDPSTGQASPPLVSGDRNLVSRLINKLVGGFGTHSFARTGSGSSAGATVIDSNGLMQKCLLNEARFQRARRIRNLIGDTETFTTNWALGANTTKTNLLTLRSPNHGRPSVFRIDRASGSANMATVASAPYQVGQHTLSVFVWGDGSTQVTVRIERSGDSAGTSQAVTPPAGKWTRIYVTHSILDTSNHRLIITAGGTAASIIICDPQFEYTQGHGLPGDYVPCGVANFPAKLLADECGVDGVRYFATVNPWSAAGGGVATATANPAALPAPDGLLIEAMNATNRFYSSRDIGAAQWTLTGATAASAMGDSTLLGVGSIRKLEETATTNDHKVTQAWVGTVPGNNLIITVSAYVKAAERGIVYLGFTDKAGATSRAYFNLATLTTSNVTGTNTETQIYIEGDLIRIGFSGNCGTGASAPVGEIGVTTAAGTTNYAGTAGSGAWFGALQMERNDCPTSYVGDTGTASVLTRDSDVFTEYTANFPTINVSCECTFTPMFRTDIANKSKWYYIMYAGMSAQERFGVGLRPGLYGGGSTATYGNNWWVDVFANNPKWDGLALQDSVIANPRETVHLQFGLAPGAVTGTSNLMGYVGGVQVPTSNEVGVMTDPGRINTLNRPDWVWYFGSDRLNLPPSGPFCIRDIGYRTQALTLDAMAANA